MMCWLTKQISRLTGAPDSTEALAESKKARDRAAADCRALDAVIADLSKILSSERRGGDAESS